MQFFNTAFLGLVAMTSTSAFSLTPRSSSSVSVSNTVAHMVPLAVVARVDKEEEVEVAAEVAETPAPVAAAAVATEEAVKNTVYVGNLPFSATKEQITNLFTENGVPVLNLAMPTNPQMLDEVTGEPKSKGFAFVDVESEEMIVKAVEALNQVNLDGRTMRVNKLLPKEEVAAQKKTRDKNFTPDGTYVHIINYVFCVE
ncbi:MAG: RNA recognition motif-containing protein [Bacillariaceae sp.]|jgi:RNA recognition motif-containing protein